jgi:hypothetical protein
MRLKNKILGLSASILLVLNACDIDRIPETSLTDPSFWKGENDLQLAANYRGLTLVELVGVRIGRREVDELDVDPAVLDEHEAGLGQLAQVSRHCRLGERGAVDDLADRDVVERVTARTNGMPSERRDRTVEYPRPARPLAVLTRDSEQVHAVAKEVIPLLTKG